jgi:SP family sugar:H+ symporter-like MFS transporter
MVPSYNAEIAPAKHRGLLAGSIMTFTGGGNLWGAGMGEAFKTEQGKRGWLIPVAMQFIPAVLMLVLVPFTPESPRWLIGKGRIEQAQKNLDKLRTREQVESGATQQEVNIIVELVEEARVKDDAKWTDMIKGNIPRRLWVRWHITSVAMAYDLYRLSAPCSLSLR